MKIFFSAHLRQRITVSTSFLKMRLLKKSHPLSRVNLPFFFFTGLLFLIDRNSLSPSIISTTIMNFFFSLSTNLRSVAFYRFFFDKLLEERSRAKTGFAIYSHLRRDERVYLYSVAYPVTLMFV